MERREFLAASLGASALAGSGALGSGTSAGQGGGSVRQYYELRLYHLRRGPQVKRLEDYLRDAAIPAWNRNGLSPIGVFTILVGPRNPTYYVLIPCKSLESFAAEATGRFADDEFKKAAAPFWNAPATDPAFVRVESSLMVAFETFPSIEVPPGAREHRPRIFELRTYESHSKQANLKKIEMFNRSEIAIFRRTGLRPVFFGETLVGTNLPNLTYMLVFDDLAARDKVWGTFVADPEWKRLSTTPGYTDGEIVSNITNTLLAPTAYSQI